MQRETQLQIEKSSSLGHTHDYDIIVVGAGPSGMSAAICAARAQLKVLVLDKAIPGGEASTAYRVDNYLGFPGGVMGLDLARQMEEHMRTFNIDFVCATVDDVRSMGPLDQKVSTDMGRTFLTKAVILSVGLEPKPLGREFEKRFFGRGVSYYAQGGPYSGGTNDAPGACRRQLYRAIDFVSSLRVGYVSVPRDLGPSIG